MKEKLRGFLGFLGLVEDEYGEYGPSNAPRPFSEQPEDLEPEWAPAPAPAHRTFPTQPANPTPFRNAPSGPPPQRNTSISVLDGPNGTPRVRPIANPNAARGISPFSQERDVAIVTPDNYDDSRRITDLLRSNRAVVLTTLEVDQGLARRLVDFTAGTAYAMNAKIEMLVRGVYLVSPQGMHVGPEIKERLRAADYHAFDQA
ncbi:MAG TPA: cell division protein SepF [Acidimicrobiales bacterium]|jgi:FtsZ-interacting cell division protein YlmF|nr:cell division protein SepF [Acidimicrobiales bacterium]